MLVQRSGHASRLFKLGSLWLRSSSIGFEIARSHGSIHREEFSDDPQITSACSWRTPALSRQLRELISNIPDLASHYRVTQCEVWALLAIQAEYPDVGLSMAYIRRVTLSHAVTYFDAALLARMQRKISQAPSDRRNPR